jgi:hypothetical protein
MAFSVEAKRMPVRSGYARGGHRIGAMLDQLRRESYHVLQGVELTDEGSIDYLVMGPTGVFAIATVRHFDGSMLATAKRQAARLHEVLEVAVTPVICPPGRQGRGPFQHEGVWIVRRDDLTPWLRAQANDVLEFVRFPRVADRL